MLSTCSMQHVAGIIRKALLEAAAAAATEVAAAVASPVG